LSEDTKELYAKFPIDLKNIDRKGYPVVLWMSVGDWNINKYLKEDGSKAEFFRYCLHKNIEAVTEARKQWLTTDGAIDQFVSIVDMAGISFKNVASTACKLLYNFFRKIV